MIETIDKNLSHEKTKVLALCDYACATGFAQVASNILMELEKTGAYELHVIGINYDCMPYDVDRFPGIIYPAISVSNMHAGDVYGRQRFLDLLGTGQFDVAFIIQDTFVMQPIMEQIKETNELLKKKFKTIMYYPIDAAPKKEWIEKCVDMIDYPVPYTNYAKEESIKAMPDVEGKLCKPLYHGTNFTDFHYVEDRAEVAEFRKKYFAGSADGKHLIINVNRNQPRKDVIRNFMILKELRNREVTSDQVALYLHMAHDDAGGNVLVMADHFGFELQKDYILPSPKLFNVNRGLDNSVMNMLYNAADSVLSTTLGEGWGLSITEAMATRTPVIAPDNTSLTEMLADNRGILVPSGNTPSMWITKEGDNERLRPLMDVEKAADAIQAVMAGELPDVDAAEKWAKEHSWENICKEWKVLFERAALDAAMASKKQEIQLNREQRRALKKQKVGL